MAWRARAVMERMVLAKLEARRMVFVGSWSCGWMEKNTVWLVSYLENDEEKEEKQEEERKNISPLSLIPSSFIPPPLQYQTLQTEKEKKRKKKENKKKTYHPPSTSTPIPTNPSHHRKNSIQHHNPHRSPHQSLQSTHIEMRIPNREEIYVGSL